LAHYWRLAHELRKDLPPEHADEAVALIRRLEGLRHALWDGRSAADVDAAAKGFDKVRETIEELWPHLPDPPPLMHVRVRQALPPLLIEEFTRERPSGRRYLTRPQPGGGAWVLDDVDWDLAALAAESLAAEVPAAEPVAAAGMPAVLPQAPAPAPRPAPMSAAEADRVVAAARTTQWVVLATSIAVALVTAFSALYVGKAWGTPWDYLFAGAWGLTTQAVVTAIAAAIGGLGALGAVKQGLGAPRL
jgi:hypothetical protein